MLKNFLSKYFLWLLAAEAVLCTISLSYAPVRSIKLIAAVAAAALVLVGLAAGVGRFPAVRGRLSSTLDHIAANLALFRLLTWACVLVFLAAWVYLFLPVDRQGGALNLYLLSQPLAAWLVVIALEAGLLLFLWRGLRWPLPNGWKAVLKTGALVLTLLLLLWGFVTVTRLGLDPVGVFWYAPGTPLLLVQALFAWMLGLLFLWAENRRNGRNPGPRLDLAVAALLWGAACLLWLSTPVTRPTIFQPTPVAPNFEPYPFSDSANYDVNAQGFLAGQGFSLDPSIKPIYSLFLAFAHMLVGQDYTRIVSLQVIFLALIPAGLYTLGALFSMRPVGLIVAVLFILREKNSIELTNVIQVSHVKLLLSDLPATALMTALMVFFIGWLLKPESRRLWALAAGGVLGMSIVLRAQVVVIIPFLWLGAALAFHQHRRPLFKQGALLMLIGVLASTLPWLGYGYFAQAQVKSPDYLHLLALQFRSGPVEELKQLPGETMQEFDARIQEKMFEYVRANPGLVAHSMVAYFFRNAIQSIAWLPLSPQLETDPASYASRLSFWDDWRGALPGESPILLALHLILLAFGVGALWSRFRHVGLALGLVFIGYVVSLALPMLSGWRFLLPVDWIVAFYIAVGSVELARFGHSLFAHSSHPLPAPVETADAPAKAPSSLPWPRVAVLALLFALTGLSLPLARSLIPVRYLPQTGKQLLASYTATTAHVTVADLPDADAVAAFLQQENALALHGRALYPRFFPSGSGLRSTGWASFIARDYDRLGFYVVGPFPTDVVLPLGQPPSIFPHAADVLVFGCQRDPDVYARRYVQAWVVVVRAENDIFLRASGPMPDCTLGS